MSNQETLTKIAEATSVQTMIGGRSVVDVIQNVFKGSTLEGMVAKVMAAAGKTTRKMADHQ